MIFSCRIQCISKANIDHTRVGIHTSLYDTPQSQLLASIVVKMLINDSCDLNYSLAKSFDFQLAGKTSFFLNSYTETKNRKQEGFIAIETHGKS